MPKHERATSAEHWGVGFWADWGERVGSVVCYELIAFITTTATMKTSDLSFEQLWPVYGVPIALAAVKGLAANFMSPKSGASLIPAPPGPVVEE